MFKLILARVTLAVRKKILDSMERHLDKRKEYYKKAEALGNYTPALMLFDTYHKVWCYACLGISACNAKLFEKLTHE